jgi:succinoglycan biosynthesis transport protein ExoP
VSQNGNLILAGCDPEQIQFSPTAAKMVADLNYRYCIRNANREWEYYLRVLQNHWRLATLFTAAVFSVIAIVTYSITPLYESTSRAEIEPPGLETFSLATDNSGMSDPYYLDTQAELLKSEALATAVIRKLRLDREPIFVGKHTSEPDTKLTSKVQLPRAESAALGFFQDHLTVSFVRKSRMLEAKFASPDPSLSMQVLNTLMEQFVESDFKNRYDAIARASELLSRQMDDIRDKARASAQALVEFQKVHGIVDIDEKQSSVSEKIADLNRQLTQAETDRIQLEAYLKGIQTGHQESLPQIRESSLMQSLTQELIERRAELSNAQTVYGEKSPNVQKLEHQIDELQSQILSEEEKTVLEIQTNYEAARAREDLMSREIKGTTNEMSEMAQYISLKREAQRDADLYTSLYARVKEVGITAASKSGNIRVVDQARMSDRPTRPRRRVNLALGFVLGLIGGVAIAFVLEGLNSNIRSAEDIEKSSGLPALALIPHSKLVSNDGSDGLRACSFFDKPFSPEAEAVRDLQCSILLANRDCPPRALLVASPLASEGKTTIAINLAFALSQIGATCLVDADLRKPGVASALGLKPVHGLTDVLRGSVRLKDALVGVAHFPRLAILTAGLLLDDFGQLLASDRMRDVLRVLNESCRFVVIDSPPLIPYADGRLLSSMVDSVILVCRYGSTSRDSMARCAEILGMLHAPVLGVVLNGVDSKSSNYEYAYHGHPTTRRGKSALLTVADSQRKEIGTLVQDKAL